MRNSTFHQPMIFLLIMILCYGSIANAQKSTIIPTGHRGSIGSSDWSPQGDLLVTGSKDGDAILWDAVNFKELRTFSGHQGLVRTVLFSKDMQKIITVGKKSMNKDSSDFILVWEITTGKKLQEIEVRGINSHLRLSADGRTLIYLNNYHHAVTTIDLLTGKKNAYRDDLRALDVALLPDGKGSVTLGNTSKNTYDKTDGSFIHIWSFAKPEQPEVYQIEKGSSISSVYLNAEGTKTFVGYADGSIRLFELPSGKMIMERKMGNVAIKRTCLSKSGSHFVIVNENGTVTAGLVANAATAVSWQEKKIGDVRISADGLKVFVAVGPHYGKIYQTTTGKVLGLLSGNTQLLSFVGFSKDNHQILISTSENGNYELDIASGKLTKTETKASYSPKSADELNELKISFRQPYYGAPDTETMGDYSFTLWNKKTGKAVAITIFENGEYMIYNAAGEFEFSDNARKLLYNVIGTKATALLPTDFPAKKGIFQQFIAASSLSHRSISGAPSIQIKPIAQKDLLPELNVVIPNPNLLNFACQIFLNGEPLQNDIYFPPKPTKEIRYSFNLLKYYDEGIAIWGAKNRVEVKLYHIGKIKTFVTSALMEFNILQNNTPKLIIASGHSAGITALAATADGKYLFTGDGSGYVKCWDLRAGIDIKSFHVGAAVLNIKVSADGKYIITDAITDRSNIRRFENQVIEVKTSKIIDNVTRGEGTDIFSFYPSKNAYFKRGSRSYTVLSDKKSFLFTPEDNVLLNDIATTADGKLEIMDISEFNGKKWIPVRRILDGLSGKEINRIADQNGSNLNVSADGNYYFDSSYKFRSITVFNAKTNKVYAEINLKRHEGINDVTFSADGKKILISTPLGYRFNYDLAAKQLQTDSTWALKGTTASFSNQTGNFFYVGDSDGTISIINLDKKQIDKKFTGKELLYNKYVLNRQTGTMYLSDLRESKLAYLLSFKPGEHYKTLTHDKIISDIGFSPDHNKILTVEEKGNAYIWDVASGTKINQIHKGGGTIAIANYRNDGTIRVLLDSVVNNKHLGLLADMNGNTIKRGLGSDDFSHLYTDRNYKDMDVIGSSGNSIFFKKNQSVIQNDPNNVVAKLVLFKDGEWILYSPDGYYTGSRNASKLLAYDVDGEIHSFNQYDLQFNRADIMLERLNLVTKIEGEIYKKAYLKRVKSLGFNEAEFSANLIYDAPNITIGNAETLRSIASQKQAELEISITDAQYKLKNYNVYVNNVPLFQGLGKTIMANQANREQVKLAIPLAYGKNSIEIAAYNEKGVRGSSENLILYNNEKVNKPSLYLVTIGAGKYNNPKLNLQYPEKDAADIAKVFNASSIYKNVLVKSLTQDSVTVANVLALKKWLSSTQIDDKVIIFYAGHGVRDQNKDYYLGTRNMDFAHPEQNGLSYDQLESLMDGIPSRSKMIAIDACYAGEADKEDIEQQQSNYVTKENVRLRSGGNKATVKKSGAANNMNLLKELFVDIRKKTGTTVIASSGAVESARESNMWNNSVFTYCLVQGLGDKAADFDEDGTVLISELQRYLEIQVPKLTNNLQKPTSRIENFANDFAIW